MKGLSPRGRSAAENLFEMRQGYVLDMSNAQFADFFTYFDVDIYSDVYAGSGDSKARRFREFWRTAEPRVLGAVLQELLLAVPEQKRNSENEDVAALQGEIARLNGGGQQSGRVQDFPELPALDFKEWDDDVLLALNRRIGEINALVKAEAWLSSIIMGGSVLEGALVYLAKRNPEIYNRAKASPKGANGRPRAFSEWSLSSLIDAGKECQHIRVDAVKFSHALREFRNYVHVNEQIKAKFEPDRNTAWLCIGALKVALDHFIELERRRRK